MDVATGTADLAIAETKLNPDKIIGIDISENMLAVGREKTKSYPNIELQLGDGEHLPFSEQTFDAVSVSLVFEILKMYLPDLLKCRVLKQMGKYLY